MVDGEVTRQHVKQVGRRHRAHQGQRHRLAAEQTVAGVDLHILEALIVGQQRHVENGREQRGVEDVVGQVAAVENAAVGQADLTDGEAAAAGLELASGADIDGGGVAAVTVVGGAGIEGGVAGLHQSVNADDDLGRGVVVAVVEGHRVAAGKGQRAVVGQRHRCLIRTHSDLNGHVRRYRERAPWVDGEVAWQDVKQVGRRHRAHQGQRHRLAAEQTVAGVDLHILEALIVGQQRHVEDGREQRGVEDVVAQVAAVENAAVG